MTPIEEPLPDGPMEAVATRVDTRRWTGTPTQELAGWLGADFEAWEGDQLVIRHPDVHSRRPPAGWLLIRWPDGGLTVASPHAARLRYRPLATEGRS